MNLFIVVDQRSDESSGVPSFLYCCCFDSRCARRRIDAEVIEVQDEFCVLDEIFEHCMQFELNLLNYSEDFVSTLESHVWVFFGDQDEIFSCYIMMIQESLEKKLLVHCLRLNNSADPDGTMPAMVNQLQEETI